MRRVVLITVTIKSAMCLHLQDQRISQANKKQKLLVAAFLVLGILFGPKDGKCFF